MKPDTPIDYTKDDWTEDIESYPRFRQGGVTGEETGKRAMAYFAAKYRENAVWHLKRFAAAIQWWERNHMLINTVDDPYRVKIDTFEVRYLYVAFVLLPGWEKPPSMDEMLEIQNAIQEEDKRRGLL